MNSLLPQIGEKRLRTEGKTVSYKSSINRNSRKYTISDNQMVGNEYLKNWAENEAEIRRLQKQLKTQQRSRDAKVIKGERSVNRDKSAKRHILYTEYSSSLPLDCNFQSQGATSSLTTNKPKPEPGEPQSEAEQFYTLEIRGKEATKQKLKLLNRRLELANPLFQKTSPVVNESLLKVGSIATFAAGEYVYKEGLPIKSIGLILWGEVVMKYRRQKVKYICVAGSSIGEELIFEKVDFSAKRFSSIDKGELCASERCKALRSSGVLFVREKEFGYLVEDLTKWGFKDEITRFQNLLHRHYLSKREFRSIMH